MPGLPILDLVIGLIFIYFLLSLVCSSVQEIYANISGMRYKGLEKWVLRTFQQNGFGRQILNHDLIQGVFQRNYIKRFIPFYLTMDHVKQGLGKLVRGDVRRLTRSA